MDLSCHSLVQSLPVGWHVLAGLRWSVLAGMLKLCPVVSHAVGGVLRVLLMIVEVQKKSKKYTSTFFEASVYVKSDSLLLAVAKQII